MVEDSQYTIALERRRSAKIDLSIIVPVYNTSAYVGLTLDSLAQSGLRGREIIAVNDGSVDDSEAVVANWFQRTGAEGLIVRTANRGLSAARNTGAAFARGHYLGFFDSDDIADANTQDHMMASAVAHDADLVLARALCLHSATGGMWDFPDVSAWNDILDHRSLVVTTLAREPRLFRLEPNMSTRLFKRSFFEENRIAFPEGLHYEDFPVHAKSVRLARKVALVGHTVLLYRTSRPGQITAQQGKQRFDMIETAALALSEGRCQHVDVEAQRNLAEMAVNLLFWSGKHTSTKDRAMYFERAVSILQPYRPWFAERSAESEPKDARSAVLASFVAGRVDQLQRLALILKHDIREPAHRDSELKDIAKIYESGESDSVSRAQSAENTAREVSKQSLRSVLRSLAATFFRV